MGRPEEVSRIGYTPLLQGTLVAFAPQISLSLFLQSLFRHLRVESQGQEQGHTRRQCNHIDLSQMLFQIKCCVLT